MKRTHNKIPELSLAVQYGIDDPQLARWRIRRWVQCALAMSEIHKVRRLNLTVRLVGKAEGKSLNQTYRHKGYATNVLTFQYDAMTDDTGHIMSDVVICTPILKQEAKAQKKTYVHHAAHLVVHGTLHALGYDHIEQRQAEQMEQLERQVLARFGIADPYAV